MGDNLKKRDVYIRELIGITIILAGVAFHGWWLLGGIPFLITAAAGWCPVYSFLNINERK